MEQYINTNYKKRLIRLYKEYDLYQYIKPQYKTVLRYNLKYEKHTLEEAIDLQDFWKAQTQHFLPYNERIIYDIVKYQYYDWLCKTYITELKKLIIAHISKLKIKNTKKKKVIARLIKIVDSYTDIGKLYKELDKCINSRFGLATLIPFQLISELSSVIKNMKVD